MMRTLLRIFLLALLATGLLTPGPAEAAETSGHGELSALIDTALARNPALQAVKEQQLSASHKINPAGALADPVLSFAFSNYPVDNFNSDVTPMTGNEVKLSQKLPYPGKRKAQKEMAAQDSLWLAGVYAESRLELIRQIKDSYFSLYFIDRSLVTVRANLARLDDFSRLVESRYQVGKGKQSDVLKIHLERTRQRDRLIQLERQRDTVQRNLNRLADRPVTTPIQTPVSIRIEALDLDLDTLQKTAEQQRPFFAAWQARIEKARNLKELARLDYKPDLTLWAGYRFRDDDLPDEGTDFASAGISFNLPFNRSKRASAVSASEAALNQTHNQFADFRGQVEFAIDDAFHTAQRNHQLVALYETGIIPQSRQLYASTLAAYQVGSADFPELLTALLARDQYETGRDRVVSEYLQAVARLEAASGVPIDLFQPERQPEN